MATQLQNDPRLKQVMWKDLLHLSESEIAKELLLSLPWLIGSLLCAYLCLYIPALVCSFFFFLTGLRQSHNAQHHTLGISSRATAWFLFVLSSTMMASMHAVKYNHLQHHKHTLNDNDIEAMSAHMPAWKAIMAGPYFIIKIHIHAIHFANTNYRKWIIFELLVIFGMLMFAYIVVNIHWISYHITVMLIGECLTSFFAVWTVHHDCDKDKLFSRTMRGFWQTKIFYNMFYHTEHHLFPKVPTCHLDVLAKRIDAVIPEIKNKRIF